MGLVSRAVVATAILLAQLAESSPLRRRGYSASFSSVIAFGDSYTDNGTGAWIVSNETWPANPNYYGHRFSNGPTWAEDVASGLGVPLHDYAVGGATTDNSLVQGYTGPGSTIPVPSILERIDNFVAAPPAGVDPSTALFAIFGGINDVLFNSNITASQSVRAIASGMEKLQSIGAQSFVLLNYPDISELPYDYFITFPNASSDITPFHNPELVKAQFQTFSETLGTLLSALAAQIHGVLFVDFMTLFDQFQYYAQPSAYGFDPLGFYGSCLVGVYQEVTDGVTVCSPAQAARRVFWDEYHPTKHTHQLMGQKVLTALGAP